MLMRDDLSNNLVHLTKGLTAEPARARSEASATLQKIMLSRKLVGGTGFIRGGYKCVCFSEAPISKISYLLASGGTKKFRYQPYGVLFDKTWLYERGARPAIYGPDADFDLLPEELRFRHVRFVLSSKYNIDHTEEREWRMRVDSLVFCPEVVTIVVPDRRAKDAFQRRFGDSWHYLVLADLGVTIGA